MDFKKCPSCSRDLACVDVIVKTQASGQVDINGYMLVGRYDEELVQASCEHCGALLEYGPEVTAWDWGADVE